jgi:hypothetical protein
MSEHAVTLFSERAAGFGKADERKRLPDRLGAHPPPLRDRSHALRDFPRG